MRMSNPSVRRYVSKAERGELAVETSPSTYKGVYLKTFLFALVAILAAVGVYVLLVQTLAGNVQSNLLAVVLVGLSCSFIPMLVISMVITFVPSTAKVLGWFYVAIEGALLGFVSFLFELIVPGVALAAILGTAIVFVLCIVLNRVLQVRVKSGFLRGFLIVLMSVFVLQMIMLPLYLLRIVGDMAYFGWQLGVSVVFVVWAAVMILMDLHSVDVIVQYGADKKYEWAVAFSLTVTLIYLYFEILELLVRVFALFGRNRS